MAVEIYHGTYVTAEDAHDYIDEGTILAGCSMMTDASTKISAIAEKINNLKQLCNANVLTISGQTMEGKIEEFETSTSNFSSSISELSSSVSAATQRALDKRQTILNEEARQKDQRLIQEHNKQKKEVD